MNHLPVHTVQARVITWVGVADGQPAEVHLVDRLFTEEQPDAGGRDFRTVLNPIEPAA